MNMNKPQPQDSYNIGGIGFSKKGIKFNLYSSRDYSMFGIYEPKMKRK